MWYMTGERLKMAILTTFPTRNWKITFSEDNSNLAAGGITITGNSVTSLSSSGITRDAVLHTADSDLEVSDITATGVSGVTVVSVENGDIANYLNQIRWLLNARLTQVDLSDQQILNPFLRSAEYETYDALGVTESQYDTRANSDSTFQEKVRLSTLYRTAALLVPAIPDIIRQGSVRASYQWAEFDPKEKIANFIRLSTNEIEEYIPEGSQRSGYVARSFQRRNIEF